MHALQKKLLSLLRKQLIHPMNNISLRKRLLLSNLTINIILVAIIATWTSYTVYSQMLTQSTYSMKKNFNQAISFINTKLETMINLSDAILLNSYLNNIINSDYSSVIDATSDARSLRLLIQNFEMTDGIDHVRIYVDDSWNIAVDGYHICSIDQLKDSKLLEKLLVKKGIKLFSAGTAPEYEPFNNKEVLSLFRVMYSTDNYNDIAFILRLDMYKDEFESILSNANLTSDSLSFLCDNDGNTIVSSGHFPETLLSRENICNLLSLPESRQSDISAPTGKYLALKSGVPLTDWNIITLVPYSSFFIDFHNILTLIILISLLIIAISLGMFSFISYSVTRRIFRLCRHIKKTETGDLAPISAPDYHDEIGLLYRTYNHMIIRIRQLLRENYNMLHDLKNAEYKALQSQINPHFLYNTLDMISWFSMQGKANEINEVVYSLARFYKISLSKGKDIITIGEETELTDCYINIQTHRFKNKIRYLKDMDPLILGYSIPKITIQPLVENAIFHGILEKNDATGYIELRGRLEDDVIHITVTDNGIGMDSSSAILNSSSVPGSRREPQHQENEAPKSSDDHGSHYGLHNIVLRLKLLYGPEYGLSIESSPGHGTTIHIHIPALSVDHAQTAPDFFFHS